MWLLFLSWKTKCFVFVNQLGWAGSAHGSKLTVKTNIPGTSRDKLPLVPHPSCLKPAETTEHVLMHTGSCHTVPHVCLIKWLLATAEWQWSQRELSSSLLSLTLRSFLPFLYPPWFLPLSSFLQSYLFLLSLPFSSPWFLSFHLLYSQFLFSLPLLSYNTPVNFEDYKYNG